jgi:hypothetical protein
MPEGAHIFNLHGETVTVERVAKLINEQASQSNGDLVTFGGPPIPIAPAMDDSAIRSVMTALPCTRLDVGVRQTMERFAALRDGGRLDTSDLES